jgi:hypothetical protein
MCIDTVIPQMESRFCRLATAEGEESWLEMAFGQDQARWHDSGLPFHQTGAGTFQGAWKKINRCITKPNLGPPANGQYEGASASPMEGYADYRCKLNLSITMELGMSEAFIRSIS